MDNNIICPHCKKNIPLNDALAHEIREEIAEKARVQLIEDRKKLQMQFELDRKKLSEETEEKLRKKIEDELSLKIKDTKNEAEELKQQNKTLSEQLLETNKLVRQIKQERDLDKVEQQKKLLEEEDKIRLDAKKQADDENRLKFAEQQKRLEDMQKALEDAKRKSEQGSQQLQGEVLELEIERVLAACFPADEIKAVAKGVRGGDVTHIVKSNTGHTLGTILWELKRTRDWSNSWIPKLKQDQRVAHADAAVIISEAIPQDIKNFGYKDGVWIGNISSLEGLAHAIRHTILEVAKIRQASNGKAEKMEILYNYIYSNDFEQRIQAIAEAFKETQDEIEREKQFFARKWARQEKAVRKAIDNSFGIRGDVEGITGKELDHGPDIESLPSGEDSEQAELL